MKLLLALPLLAACGGPSASAVSPPKVAVPPASPIAQPCSTWPLPHGCVTALAAGPEMLCAIAGERTFCWGAGATANDPQHREILVLTKPEREALGVRADASPDPKSVSCEVETEATEREHAQLHGYKPALLSCRTGDPADFYFPVSPELGVGTSSDILKVVTGLEHACLLARGGSIFCFGGTWSSARGERTAWREFSEPNRVALDGATGAASDLVALGTTTCALADGDVFCWGGGRYFPPHMLEIVEPKFVAAVYGASPGVESPRVACFLGEKGELWCGPNQDYQLVSSLTDVKQIVGMRNGEVCARLGNGRVACIDAQGAVTDRPFLSPAKELTTGIPCALLEGGQVHCDAWRHQDKYPFSPSEPNDVEATAVSGLGVPRGIATIYAGGRPAVCAITERGRVGCWGVVGFDSAAPLKGDYWDRVLDHMATKPIVLVEPEDVVEISNASCVRTRSGEVWTIALDDLNWTSPRGSPRPKQSARLAAYTTAHADLAVKLEQGARCTGRRADGSAFVLAFTPSSWPPPSSGPGIALEPFVPFVRDDFGAGRGAPVIRVGNTVECAIRPPGDVVCRSRMIIHQELLGPVFDPFQRSTLPIRVIPPG